MNQNRTPLSVFGRMGGAVALVSIGLILAGARPVSAATLAIQNGTALPGGTATVAVSVDAIALAGLQFTLNYNPALALSDADVAGGALFSLPEITSNTQTSGVAYLAMTGNKNVQGPGSAVLLTFHIPASATPGTIYSLTLQDAQSNDQNGVITNLAVRNGILSVVSVLPGDLNGDGKVDAVDLSIMVKLFLGLMTPSPAQLAAGDVRPNPGTNGRPYGDGVIRSDDVNWLFRRVLGLESAP